MSMLPDILKTENDGYFAHPTAEIDAGVILGAGCKIWRFSYLREGSVIGNNCNIGQNVSIGPNVTVGSGCKIQNNVSLFDGITFEDDVFCGPGAVFTNDLRPRARLSKNGNFMTTLVRRGASIGANATILCGITIGENAFIGAGCVVTKDVPAHALVMGNPGKCVGHVCTCGETLNPDKLCNACGAYFPQLLA